MEEGWVISSESCGFLSIGARYEREVHPGEIIEISKHGVKTVDIVNRPNAKPPAFCIFEYVYFARSDSIFEGEQHFILWEIFILNYNLISISFMKQYFSLLNYILYL